MLNDKLNKAVSGVKTRIDDRITLLVDSEVVRPIVWVRQLILQPCARRTYTHMQDLMKHMPSQHNYTIE